MSKRISTEAKFLAWIDTAPVEVVTSIMSIATARAKARTKAEQPAVAQPVVRRKTRKLRTNASTQTVVPGALQPGANA